MHSETLVKTQKGVGAYGLKVWPPANCSPTHRETSQPVMRTSTSLGGFREDTRAQGRTRGPDGGGQGHPPPLCQGLVVGECVSLFLRSRTAEFRPRQHTTPTPTTPPRVPIPCVGILPCPCPAPPQPLLQLPCEGGGARGAVGWPAIPPTPPPQKTHQIDRGRVRRKPPYCLHPAPNRWWWNQFHNSPQT